VTLEPSVHSASQREHVHVEAEQSTLHPCTPTQVNEQSAPSEQGNKQVYAMSSLSGSTQVTSHVSPTHGSHSPGSHSPGSQPMRSARKQAIRARRAPA
jgi:hypothetical protein